MNDYPVWFVVIFILVLFASAFILFRLTATKFDQDKQRQEEYDTYHPGMSFGKVILILILVAILFLAVFAKDLNLENLKIPDVFAFTNSQQSREGGQIGGSGQLLPLPQLTDTLVKEVQAGKIAAVNTQAIAANYEKIVLKSQTSGYNPAFTMAVWIEESGASYYGKYPGVADMGCIYYPRENFDAQVDCFLRLWTLFSGNTNEIYKMCRGKDQVLSFREFLLIYEGGGNSCASNNFMAEPNFPNRLRYFYGLVTGGSKLNF